ncbi:hypothetical protein CFAM422_002864 [Trichoderma lentiforme]|uniref:Uncharacterized protein n=1 Tax=Trichoderma lentiforme TaxID=1567552 RepID=A0A9P4XNG8_9HYPO|nr:hypothetical protein CFAM422_002864 [Trichoderma lentiforme]
MRQRPSTWRTAGVEAGLEVVRRNRRVSDILSTGPRVIVVVFVKREIFILSNHSVRGRLAD